MIDNNLNPLSQVFLADFNGKLLFNWIPLNTNFHNYFKVKPITPILSQEMIHHTTHLPINMKYDSKTDTGKLLLREILQKYSLDKRVPQVLMSPVWGAVEWKDLAAWILSSGVRTRMQLQMHKLIWGADVIGV